jgi:hypothetical protein
LEKKRKKKKKNLVEWPITIRRSSGEQKAVEAEHRQVKKYNTV